MTRDPVTVAEDDSLETVVELMERRRIKRLPVLRDGKMVGIVSRANLMHALVSLARETETPAGGDSAIRDRILAAFAKQPWAPQVNVVVKNGVAGIVGHDHRRARTASVRRHGRERRRRAMRCTIIWFGSSRCPAWHSPRPRMKLVWGQQGRKTPFTKRGADRSIVAKLSGERGDHVCHDFSAEQPNPPHHVTGGLSGALCLACRRSQQAKRRSRRRPNEALSSFATYCSKCHSVDRVGPSPLKVAPPFRTLHDRYPVETLQESLAEGIVTGHPSMPEFQLDPGQVDDVIAYLKSLER